jgi:nucleotide-binding universal stress UspA family protein
MKILVPIDGSPASIRAITLAIDQVKAVVGGSLVIVNIQNPATLGVTEGLGIMSPAWLEQEEETAAIEAMQEAVTTCRDARN